MGVQFFAAGFSISYEGEQGQSQCLTLKQVTVGAVRQGVNRRQAHEVLI